MDPLHELIEPFGQILGFGPGSVRDALGQVPLALGDVPEHGDHVVQGAGDAVGDDQGQRPANQNTAQGDDAQDELQTGIGGVGVLAGRFGVRFDQLELGQLVDILAHGVKSLAALAHGQGHGLPGRHCSGLFPQSQNFSGNRFPIPPSLPVLLHQRLFLLGSGNRDELLDTRVGLLHVLRIRCLMGPVFLGTGSAKQHAALGQEHLMQITVGLQEDGRARQVTGQHQGQLTVHGRGDEKGHRAHGRQQGDVQPQNHEKTGTNTKFSEHGFAALMSRKQIITSY